MGVKWKTNSGLVETLFKRIIEEDGRDCCHGANTASLDLQTLQGYAKEVPFYRKE